MIEEEFCFERHWQPYPKLSDQELRQEIAESGIALELRPDGALILYNEEGHQFLIKTLPPRNDLPRELRGKHRLVIEYKTCRYDPHESPRWQGKVFFDEKESKVVEFILDRYPPLITTDFDSGETKKVPLKDLLSEGLRGRTQEFRKDFEASLKELTEMIDVGLKIVQLGFNGREKTSSLIVDKRPVYSSYHQPLGDEKVAMGLTADLLAAQLKIADFREGTKDLW